MPNPQVGDVWYAQDAQSHFLITDIVRGKSHPNRYFILWLDNKWGYAETEYSEFKYSYRFVA